MLRLRLGQQAEAVCVDELPINLRRRRRARSAPPGPLRTYYGLPVPPGARDWREVEFLALDLETTGSDPAADEIVSPG